MVVRIDVRTLLIPMYNLRIESDRLNNKQILKSRCIHDTLPGIDDVV